MTMASGASWPVGAENWDWFMDVDYDTEDGVIDLSVQAVSVMRQEDESLLLSFALDADDTTGLTYVGSYTIRIRSVNGLAVRVYKGMDGNADVVDATTPEHEMTYDRIAEYVWTKLGYGFVTFKVELEFNHVFTCIQDAWGDARKYLRVLDPVVYNNRTDDILIDMEYPHVGVARCKALRLESFQDFRMINEFYLPWQYNWPVYPLQDYVYWRSYHEMWQRALGVDADWHLDRLGKKLYVNGRGGIYDIAVLWLCAPQQRHILLSNQQSNLQEDFRDLTLAYCKQILARIRGKFGSVPAPGGNLTLDDASLREEAKETITAVRERWGKMCKFFSFSVG